MCCLAKSRMERPLSRPHLSSADHLCGRNRRHAGRAPACRQCRHCDGTLDSVLDVLARAQASLCDVAMVRIDAGFPSATLLAGLEGRGIDYVARLKATPALDRLAAPHTKHLPGRRPAEPRMWLHTLHYRAESSGHARRVVLVVEERPDDLLLDRFFLVTSLEPEQLSRREVLEHYRERGTAAGHMGELKDVLALAHSSTNRPRSHWRGRKTRTATPAVDAFACNEVSLNRASDLSDDAHRPARHGACHRNRLEPAAPAGARVCAGARLIRSERRMTFALSGAAAPF